MFNVKSPFHLAAVAVFAALAVTLAVAGCAPNAGVVTTAGTSPGLAPDIRYTASGGKTADLNRVRYPLTVLAFSASDSAACCWLDPKVVALADPLWNLPVTVVQVALPKRQCPHGQDCVETCNLRKGRLISLCDGKKLAWNAYGQPAPGTIFLIGPENKILMQGTLANSKAVIDEAVRLGQAAEKEQHSRNRNMDLY